MRTRRLSAKDSRVLKTQTSSASAFSTSSRSSRPASPPTFAPTDPDARCPVPALFQHRRQGRLQVRRPVAGLSPVVGDERGAAMQALIAAGWGSPAATLSCSPFECVLRLVVCSSVCCVYPPCARIRTHAAACPFPGQKIACDNLLPRNFQLATPRNDIVLCVLALLGR
jgi:hypothetical protein